MSNGEPIIIIVIVRFVKRQTQSYRGAIGKCLRRVDWWRHRWRHVTMMSFWCRHNMQSRRIWKLGPGSTIGVDTLSQNVVLKMSSFGLASQQLKIQLYSHRAVVFVGTRHSWWVGDNLTSFQCQLLHSYHVCLSVNWVCMSASLAFSIPAASHWPWTSICQQSPWLL